MSLKGLVTINTNADPKDGKLDLVGRVAGDAQGAGRECVTMEISARVRGDAEEVCQAGLCGSLWRVSYEAA